MKGTASFLESIAGTTPLVVCIPRPKFNTLSDERKIDTYLNGYYLDCEILDCRNIKFTYVAPLNARCT